MHTQNTQVRTPAQSLQSLDNIHQILIRRFIFLTAFSLCLLIGFKQARADDNPFALNYQTQQKGLMSVQASPETVIYTGKNRTEDNISMLENGFDLMGVSSFQAPDIPPDLAVSHGKAIKADQALVYVKQAAGKTPASQMQFYKEAIKKGQVLTEKDVVIEKKQFDYFATYWAKLPPPALGVHMVKLLPKDDLDAEEKQEAKQGAQGLKILAVIHDSPAEQAGILRGDQLTAINNHKLNKPEDLYTHIRQLRGKAVAITLLRNDTPTTLTVTLR